MSNKLDYFTKDYESFRNGMINAIPDITDEWTDFSLSNQGIVLLELQSYGLDIISYYADRQMTELFLPTAKLRQSIIDMGRLVGYRLSPPQPASVDVVFETSENRDVTIPQNFRIATDDDITEEEIIFETDESVTIPKTYTGLEYEEGGYTFAVSATQGRTIEERLGSSNGEANQTFTLNYPDVIEDSLRLIVSSSIGTEEWKNINISVHRYEMESGGKHYWVTVDDEGYLTVHFGNGINGQIPEEDAGIDIKYRTGGGKHTNVGAETITVLKSSVTGVKSVFNPEKAEGGANKESKEQAANNIPRWARSKDVIVTKQDVEDYALMDAGVEKVLVEEQFNTENDVYVYIIPTSFEAPTSNLKERLEEEMNEKVTMNNTIVVQDPEFKEFSIKMTVYVKNNYLPENVEESVKENLQEKLGEEVSNFGEDVKLMDIIGITRETEGVYNVKVDEPESDIEINELEFPKLKDIIVETESGE